jgi:hypothetical protein
MNNSKQTQNSPVDVETNFIARVMQSNQSKKLLQSNPQEWAQLRIQECNQWLESYHIDIFKTEATRFVKSVDDMYQEVLQIIESNRSLTNPGFLIHNLNVLMGYYNQNQNFFEPPMFIQHQGKWTNISTFMSKHYNIILPDNINEYLKLPEIDTVNNLLHALDEKYVELLDFIEFGKEVLTLNGFVTKIRSISTDVEKNSYANILYELVTLIRIRFVSLFNDTINYFSKKTMQNITSEYITETIPFF